MSIYELSGKIIKTDGLSIQPNEEGSLATIKASNEEAITGTDTNKVMTPASTVAVIDDRISTAIAGALIYRGQWHITEETTDYSGLNSFRPLAIGNYFEVVADEGVYVTIDGIEWSRGDGLVFVKPCSAEEEITSDMVLKRDHTDKTDTVYLDAPQTLTNKTLNADSNTISEIGANNFKETKLSLTETETKEEAIIPSVSKVEELVSVKEDKLTSVNAGEGISIIRDEETDEVLISNTNKSATWGQIDGDINDQKDLQDIFKEINTKLSYDLLNKLDDYLYEIHYSSTDAEFANEYFTKEFRDPSITTSSLFGTRRLGQCSSLKNGNFYGRNYDWFYDNAAIFLVRTLATQGKHAVMGLSALLPLTGEFVESREYSELYKVVPYAILDGINDAGLVANINVIHLNDFRGNPNGICALQVVSEVLYKFDNATEAAYWLKDNYWISDKFGHYAFHFMIADKVKTYIIEDGEVYDVTNTTPYMTNFRVTQNFVVNNKVDYNIVASHDLYGAGLERMDIILSKYATSNTRAGMRETLEAIKYTNMYKILDSNQWLSELCDDYGTLQIDLNSIRTEEGRANALEILNQQAEIFRNRTREESNTWQTVHSSIYDLNKKALYLLVQEEDVSKEKTFYFNSESIAEWGNITGNISEQKDLQDEFNTKQDVLIFDNVPTNGSNNPVTSDGIKTYVDTEIAEARVGTDNITIEVFDNSSFGGSDHDIRVKAGDSSNGLTVAHLKDSSIVLAENEEKSANTELASILKIKDMITNSGDLVSITNNADGLLKSIGFENLNPDADESQKFLHYWYGTTEQYRDQRVFDHPDWIANINDDQLDTLQFMGNVFQVIKVFDTEGDNHIDLTEPCVTKQYITIFQDRVLVNPDEYTLDSTSLGITFNQSISVGSKVVVTYFQGLPLEDAERLIKDAEDLKASLEHCGNETTPVYIDENKHFQTITSYSGNAETATLASKAIADEDGNNIIETYATKQEIAGGLHAKSSVETEHDLPMTENMVGDFRNVRATNMNYVWVDAEEDEGGQMIPAHWDPMSGTFDLSAYATTVSVNAGLALKEDKLTSVNAGDGISITRDTETDVVTISNTNKTATFANIEGEVSDNAKLVSAFATKQNVLTAGDGISIRNDVISLLNPNVDFADITGEVSSNTALVNEIAKKADLDSPELIGTPTAPTASVETENTQIATTEYVANKFKTVSDLPNVLVPGTFYFVKE